MPLYVLTEDVSPPFSFSINRINETRQGAHGLAQLHVRLYLKAGFSISTLYQHDNNSYCSAAVIYITWIFLKCWHDNWGCSCTQCWVLYWCYIFQCEAGHLAKWIINKMIYSTVLKMLRRSLAVQVKFWPPDGAEKHEWSSKLFQCILREADLLVRNVMTSNLSAMFHDKLKMWLKGSLN